MTATKNRRCGTKLRHVTWDAAVAHKRRMVRRGASEEWVNVYACSHCDGFHVGHKPGRRKT